MFLNIPKRPIIVKNTNFQTIIVRVVFPYQEKDEELIKMAILPNMLMFMNNIYPSEESFQIARKKKYILSSACNKMVVGTTGYFCFSMVIPDTKTLGFDILDEQFEFFSQMIYNPKVIDGCFDKFELNREKRNLHLSIDNAMKNLRSYHNIKALELIDDEGILSSSLENHRYQIDNITPKNLYELYLDIINKYQPAIFVFGNVNETRINTLANKYLYKNNKYLTCIEKNYNHFLKVHDNIQIVEEKLEFKDSAISFLYKVKEMREDDFNYLSLIKNLLSSLSSRMLNKKLRDEYDLVYSSNVSVYLRFGVLEITAYINKNNKDDVISKIYEVMNEIKNPDNIREYLNNIKERKRIGLIKSLDDKYTLLNDAFIETLAIDKCMYSAFEDLLNISAEDISNFMDRLVLDTIYYTEEEEHA